MIASAPPPARATALTRCVLCELARTDSHRFPRLAPICDETAALRALVRTREDLVATRVALLDQLRAELEALLAGRHRAVLESRRADLAGLSGRPIPRRATPSGLNPQAAGGVPASLPLLRPPQPRPSCLPPAQLAAGPAVASWPRPRPAARRSIVLSLVATLTPLLRAQIRELDPPDRRGALEAHPDGHVFRSLFSFSGSTPPPDRGPLVGRDRRQPRPLPQPPRPWLPTPAKRRSP